LRSREEVLPESFLGEYKMEDGRWKMEDGIYTYFA
jgi:hypothetical protein